MDHTTVPSTEPQAVAGPSGEARKRVRSSRNRSSSSSSDSSDSSSSSSSVGSKRKRHRRHKKSKRTRHSSRTIDKLVQEISELRKHVFDSNVDARCHNDQHDNISIISGVSNELYEQNYTENQTPIQDIPNLDFTFEIETKLKEPSVPKTSDDFLKMLNDVQRFGSPNWSDVRYADTQKLYNHSPGFVDLEANDEVKSYDNLRYLANADKSYAAITYCILKQKQSLQEGIRNLLFWAKNTEVNCNNLSDKVEELFLKGEFHKTSSDLLQLVCGHRAESIEMRRESITKQVRDPFVKASLNRIPPSQTHIFDCEPFTACLDKAGGVRKVFWPPKAEGSVQSRSYQNNSSRPSRGQGTRSSTVPSRGTQCVYHDMPSHGLPSNMNTCNNPPSRGGYQHLSTCRGHTSNVPCEHHNVTNKNTFHNRGSRPYRGNYRGGRSNNATSRGNQKKYKQ
ncbi:uncharacterized protein LOC114356488 isoform X2 [Ostrinia furnacalis]|uniref:uncharacterized protein LOC114350004 isoform X2 n=1 Tax=Ostrinia furnacalis TaxID=93504 RepID=UPI00103D7FEA|nr:uncharacterized protein LOC114350004 isoform X2 [Ostrinia furnacalis]XP_028165501.1 uncharacterized protein LOC114356488 isoform X2 [Ostrinia furnacalis]